MELAKRGRVKIKIGDCVSVAASYFGKHYADQLNEKFGIVRVIGRVIEVVSGNSNFSVQWDIDNGVNRNVSLNTIQLEPIDTPIQECSDTVITIEDFQNTDEQSTSTVAATSDALLVEDFSEIDFATNKCSEGSSYALCSNNKHVLTGTYMQTAKGELVHHHPISEGQGKFLITEVLSDSWKNYKEDIHCVGAYVVWDLEEISKIGNEEDNKEENKEESEEGELKKGKGKGKGRLKIKIGDCVSVAASYFGKHYADQLNEKFGIVRVIGRVIEVVSGNSNFSVQWDIDNGVNRNVSLNTIQLEPIDTPIQECSDTVITIEDFQNTDEQSTSTVAATSDALLVEDFSEIDFATNKCSEGSSYALCSNNKHVLTGTYMQTAKGELVHHHPISEGQGKFLITEVLSDSWKNYKEDIHCVGAYVVWDLEEISKIGNEEDNKEENKEESEEGELKKGKGKGKRKRKKFELKIKASSGRTFRQRCNDIAEKGSESEDDIVTGKEDQEKKKKKGGSKKNNVNIKKKVDKASVEDQEKDKEDDKYVKSNKRRKSLNNKNQKRSTKGAEKEKDVEKDVESESESSEEEDDQDVDKAKTDAAIKAQSAIWTKGGWTEDPAYRHSFGPKLHLDSQEVQDEMGYLFHFLPVKYMREVIIPCTNDYAVQIDPNFKSITFEEMIVFMILMYSMEVYKLPERRMYWRDNKSDLFPNMDFGKFMSCNRFEDILGYLQFSPADDKTTQILQFIEAVNERLALAVSAGDIVVVDESMIKAHHRNLPGKIKIKRKPRPIGNEIKDLCDARTCIVIRMEIYEGKEPMQDKQHVRELGATCATTLRLSEGIQGSGRLLLADSWFGSVKTACELKKRGLNSIMLVKTAHSNFPRQLLNSNELLRGEWVGYTAKIDGVNLQAVSFMDLKKKQFVSTCGTVIPGNPRVTKHHGAVPRPKIAETYLKHYDSIDKHNHVRTGSIGLEDVAKTHSPHLRQFFGVMGFLLSNAYLAYRYFKPNKGELKHLTFKMSLAERMVHYSETLIPQTSLRSHDVSVELEPTSDIQPVHRIEKLDYQKPCFYCRHGYPESKRIKTSFYCSAPDCNIPLHKQGFIYRPKEGTEKELHCWELHLIHGRPKARRI